MTFQSPVKDLSLIYNKKLNYFKAQLRLNLSEYLTYS